MNKVKILHLTTDSRIGGAEKIIISLATHLDKHRYESKVVALLPGGELIEGLRDKGIEAECLGMRNKFDLRAIYKLSRIIREKKIDILHTHLFHANVLGRMVGRLAKVPVIISSLHVMEKRRHHLWLDWLTNRMVDAEICVCEAVRKFTMEKARIRPDKLVTIPNGIDVREYDLNVKLTQAISQNIRDSLEEKSRENRGEACDYQVATMREKGKLYTMDVKEKKRELGIESNYPVLGTVGRLHEQKGHIYLLKAMPAILEEYPEAVLLIVGDGPLRSKLEGLCFKLQINKTVKFLGFRKNIKELMTLIDVFILPSLWEGMPIVLLEAMALGKPIVATRVGGAEELIKDGVTGLLMPPADDEALAKALINILSRENGGRELGKIAKREVERRFTLEVMVGKTEKLYERLLIRRRKRRGKRHN